MSVAALERGVLKQIEKDLRRSGVKARLITSGRGDWRYLDIVSQNAVRQAFAIYHMVMKHQQPLCRIVLAVLHAKSAMCGAGEARSNGSCAPEAGLQP